MANIPVINLAGHRASPEGQEKYNQWYFEEHAPNLMKHPALKRVSNYRLVGTALGGKNIINLDIDKRGYPTFLSIHEFVSLNAMKEYDASPEKAAAGGEASRKIREEVLLWRVQYEIIHDTADKPGSIVNLKGPILNFAGHTASLEGQDKYIQFYIDFQGPALMKHPALKRITDYRLAGSALGAKNIINLNIDEQGYPVLLSIHEFDSLEAMKEYDASPEKTAAGGEECRKMRQEVNDRLVWRTQYELINTLEQ